MDVHVNRVPASGRVTSVSYTPGRFLPAYRHDAGAVNERSEIWIDHDGQPIVARQIVGILARRVVCRLEIGRDSTSRRALRHHEIRSRMDVFLPSRPISASRSATPCAAARPSSRCYTEPGFARPEADDEPTSEGVSDSCAARPTGRQRRFSRGVSLLPSLFTMANLFCGYACVVYAMRGEYETAAPFIGVAIVLDMLDGRIARLTGTSTDFGLQFDSLADVISFGIAPAILSFGWGLAPLGRLGWAAGFVFVTAAAMRLARFNIQSQGGGDKRYFAGMPSPAAAAIPASTVFFYPAGLHGLSRGAAGARDGARARRPDGQHDQISQLQDHRSADPPSVHRAAADRRRDHADHDASAVRARRDGIRVPRVGVHRDGGHPVPPSWRACGIRSGCRARHAHARRHRTRDPRQSEYLKSQV